MYNVRQKFKIQITIAIVVLVHNITLLQPNVPKATSHQKFIYGTTDAYNKFLKTNENRIYYTVTGIKR